MYAYDIKEQLFYVFLTVRGLTLGLLQGVDIVATGCVNE